MSKYMPSVFPVFLLGSIPRYPQVFYQATYSQNADAVIGLALTALGLAWIILRVATSDLLTQDALAEQLLAWTRNTVSLHPPRYELPYTGGALAATQVWA